MSDERLYALKKENKTKEKPKNKCERKKKKTFTIELSQELKKLNLFLLMQKREWLCSKYLQAKI